MLSLTKHLDMGEISDRGTAEMAFSAAMTGRQVYTILHTNSAFGVVPWLLDIGILPDIMFGIDLGSVAGDSAADQRDLRPRAAHRLRQGPENRRSPSRPGCHQGDQTGLSAEMDVWWHTVILLMVLVAVALLLTARHLFVKLLD